MNKSLISIIIAFSIVFGGVLFYIQKCKPVEETVTINKSVWDSIQALANKPPEIRVDTVWKTGKPIYIDALLPKPKPDTTDTTINYYSDTLKKNDVFCWVDLKVRGVLLDRQWWYEPKTMEITKEITKYVPKIIDNPVPISKNGVYLYGIAGGGQNSFIYGIGIDYITKQNKVLGYQYERLNSTSIHSVKLGIKLY